jgi:trk system potassium uptake protein TrkH
MDHRPVLGIFGYLLLMLALCLLAPLGVALATDSDSPHEISEIVALAVTPGVALGGGLWLLRRFGRYAKQLGRREGYAVVAGGWLLATLVGMLPYLLSGVLPSLSEAFFETMSGFTTTGASVFGDPGREIESIPQGIQFWRHMTQWLGGMGIIVMGVALLPFLGVGGYHLVRAETPGGAVFERDRPRIVEVAREMWRLYLLITVILVGLFWLAGMSLFDAVCHAFTTMSTGGFSTHGESMGYFGAGAQWIAIVFMFLAGMNFSLLGALLRGRVRSVTGNPEFRAYALVLGCVAAIGMFAAPMGESVEHHLRQVVFQTVSLATTTGYATADFEQWPPMMKMLLLGLMFVGGCMGSTGGSVKPARLLVYTKVVLREMYRLVYPHGVRPVKIGERVLETQVVSNILAFGSAYLVLFLAGALTMAMSGYDMPTSISASASALGNVGPGFGAIGPMANWSHLPALTQWVMSLLMLFGRLEVLSVLVLFSPWAWKK